MKSAVAVLTYNRLPVLQEELKGLSEHCSQYPLAIFDDLSQRDGTAKALKFATGSAKAVWRPDLMSDHYTQGNLNVFLARRNLGVAGNSNRAIKWFMEETDADHLVLLNDDLHVLGDFVAWYAKAHEDLGVGMLSFCDFTHHASYKWIDVRKRGYIVKICPRMTAIMTSMTRRVIEAIGYYDAQFGKFGQEHCDHMNRARFAGFMNLDGMMQPQIDVHHYPSGQSEKMLLRHQECETSVVGIDRRAANHEADEIIKRVGKSYRYRHLYRPFCLQLPNFAGAHGKQGIPVDELGIAYQMVNDFWPRPLPS
ncbi:MAG: glycosyltransferase family 2 protein [Azonexus sp.]